MSKESQERFEKMVDQALTPENAFSSPFAPALNAEREAYVHAGANEWEKANPTKTIADKNAYKATLSKNFNTDETQLPKFSKDLKEKAMAAYKGEEATVDLGATFESLGTGAFAAVASGNVSSSGFFHTIAHTLINFVKNLPFVGDFLGQVKTYVQGMLSGNNEGWTKAGETYQNNQVKQRMTAALGQYASADKLNVMVDEAAKEPFMGPSAPESSAAAAQGGSTFNAHNGALVGAAPPTPATRPGQAAGTSPP